MCIPLGVDCGCQNSEGGGGLWRISLDCSAGSFTSHPPSIRVPEWVLGVGDDQGGCRQKDRNFSQNTQEKYSEDFIKHIMEYLQKIQNTEKLSICYEMLLSFRNNIATKGPTGLVSIVIRTA